MKKGYCMDITSALKDRNTRLTCGDRSLYFEDSKWIVVEKIHMKKRVQRLIATGSEAEAVRKLLNE